MEWPPLGRRCTVFYRKKVPAAATGCPESHGLRGPQKIPGGHATRGPPGINIFAGSAERCVQCTTRITSGATGGSPAHGDDNIRRRRASSSRSMSDWTTRQGRAHRSRCDPRTTPPPGRQPPRHESPCGLRSSPERGLNLSCCHHVLYGPKQLLPVAGRGQEPLSMPSTARRKHRTLAVLADYKIASVRDGKRSRFAICRISCRKTGCHLSGNALNPPRVGRRIRSADREPGGGRRTSTFSTRRV